MADAGQWLAAARRLFDDDANDLAVLARSAARGGFAGGAHWMRRALGVLRGVPPRGEASFVRLGLRKYTLAAAGAIASGALAWHSCRWLMPLAVFAFYVIEVRMVFAFPAALDGSPTPCVDSHRLVQASASWWWATRQVMRVAGEMLFGGLCGRGFMRSWCVGCLAVLLWYEETRSAARVGP